MKKITLFVVLMSFGLIYGQTLVLNPNFGVGGKASYNFSAPSSSYCYWQNQENFLTLTTEGLKQIHPNGALNPDFGVNGNIPFTIAMSRIKTTPTNIFIGGFGQSLGAPNYYDAAIAKYDAQGQPDLQFGTNGIKTIHLGENEEMKDFVILPDGKILCAIDKYSGQYHKAAFVRLNSDGSIDSTFSPNGFKEYYFFAVSTFPLYFQQDTDGSCYLVCEGSNSTSSSSPLSGRMIKLDTNADVDLSFGSSGAIYVNRTFLNKVEIINGKAYFLNWKLSPSFGSHLVRVDLATQTNDFYIDAPNRVTGFCLNEDNTIYTFGYEVCPGNNCYYDMSITKYTAQGTIDTQFSGDGVFPYNFGPQFNPEDCFSGQIFSKAGAVYVSGAIITNSNTTLFQMANFGTTLGIPETETGGFSVVPNPTKGQFTIKNEDGLSGRFTLEVYNELGQIARKFVYEDVPHIDVDIAQLPSGLYIVKLTNELGTIHSQKLIKH